MESLFSFGLYVEQIWGLNKNHAIPAIGFRFLDYPTVVLKCDSVGEGKDNAEHDENGNINDELADDDSSFQFGKGKSCLFKNNLGELHKLLDNIPLYVMAFDTTNEKLVGCCSIPLFNLFTNLRSQIEVIGIDSPASAEEIDIYKMYNLMGGKTGEVKLQIKLNFYGTSLLTYKNPLNNNHPVDMFVQEINDKPLEDCIKTEKVISDSDNLQLDCKPTKTVEDKSVQCPSRHHKKHHSRKKKEKNINAELLDEYHNTNVYCPPPLFLNLYEKPNKATRKKLSNSSFESVKYPLESKYGSPDSISSMEEPYREVLQPDSSSNRLCIVSDNHEKKAEQKRLDSDKSRDGNLVPLGKPSSNQNIDITNLPLLSALSAEILKLTNFINNNEGDLGVLGRNASKPSVEIQKELASSTSTEKVSDEIPKKSIVNPSDNNFKKISIDVGADVDSRRVNKKIDRPKEKLKFKTTRTQKLRSKFLKQSKHLAGKVSESQEETNKNNDDIDDRQHVINQENLRLNSSATSEVLDSQIGRWMEGLQIEGGAEKPLSGSVSPQKERNDELATAIIESPDTPVMKTNPGFYTPTADEVDPYGLKEVTAENRRSSKSKMKRRSSSRVTESRGMESRGIESRNESSYANDTFVSEDDDDAGSKRYSDSRSTVSQTSSVSLPFSGRESELSHLSNASNKSKRYSNASKKSNKSSRQNSDVSSKSGKSASQRSRASEGAKQVRHQVDPCGKCKEFVREDTNFSLESNKSAHHHSISTKCSLHSNTSDKTLQQRLVTAERHLPEPSSISEKSNKYLERSNASEESNKYLERSNASEESNKYLERSNASEESSKYLGRSNASEESNDPQMKAPDSVDINSSQLSSVGLERYMAAESSSLLSDRHTMDIDDSRPATQASANASLPDDSILSPKHVSYARLGETRTEWGPRDSPVNEVDGADRDEIDTPSLPFSPDEGNAMKPNSSIYSPRKSKVNAPSFQLTKRNHGMGTLQERPLSQLSGDTTMREIDMFIGDDSLSQLTSGSSVLMTTDENLSPIGSMNIPQKYKHLNQPPGMNKFDKRQVDTVEEVDVSAEEGRDSPRDDMNTLLATYEKPKVSDFSPHQSKQFVEKKKYENVFRETLPPFSSNTNESSVDE